MRHNGILRVTDKSFDLQVLFDPAKEDVNLPTFLVDIGNGLGRKSKVISQVDVILAGLRSGITYSA